MCERGYLLAKINRCQKEIAVLSKKREKTGHRLEDKIRELAGLEYAYEKLDTDYHYTLLWQNVKIKTEKRSNNIFRIS